MHQRPTGGAVKRPWRMISILLSSAAMMAFAAAGLLKLLDLDTFHDALQTWTFLPRVLIPFVALMTPIFELMVGGLWLIGVWRRRTLLAAMLFLAVTSVAYAFHSVFSTPPDCGCLGLLAKYSWSVDLSTNVLLRNAALFAMLLTGIRLRDGAPPRAIRPHSTNSRPAFTLIETLLVIALASLLLTLLVPSLASARMSARLAASSALIRSHAGIFNIYATDYRGYMPAVTDPTAHYTVLRAGDVVYPTLYFEAVNRWHIGLASAYYDDNPRHPSFSFPGQPARDFTTFNYSQAFLADPAYWHETTRTGPAQWRAVRADETVFPAAKALLVDSASERLQRPDPDTVSGSPILTAFVDHSARQIPIQKFIPGYRRETGWDWHGVYNTVLSRGMHTINGVRGRDVE